MERIIAGRFQTKIDADAVAALMAQYEWRDGNWADFNPVAVPRLVEGASN